MPPGDDDEVTIKGLFEDAISPELQETARSAREAARALTETGVGGEAAAVGMDRAQIAAGRLKRELEGVDRAAEQHRLAQLRLTAAEQEAQKVRAKGVLTAAEAARVEGMLAAAHRDATRASNELKSAHMVLAAAQDHIAVRFLRTAGSVGFLTKAFAGLKLIATADVFTSLIGGVSSLGAAGVAAVAGLVPLLGAAGAIPALGIAAISAFGAVALLGGGIFKAAQAMSSAGPGSRQAQTALNQLGPSAADLAYQVYGVTYSLKGMREEALRSSMPALTHTLTNVRGLLPTVRAGFVGVTQAMAETVDNATTRMVAARGDLDIIASRNTALVRTMGGAVVDALDAGRHIMIGAGPMAQGFADRFAGEMRRVDNELAANPAKVEAFFNRTFDRTMAFVHVLSDFGHGIVNIFHAATPLTDHMGAGLTRMATDFREWSGSTAGQTRIQKFFTDSIPVLDQMGHLIGNVGRALGQLSTSGGTASMIHDLATIVPLLAKVLTLIQKVSSTVPGANSALAVLFLANRFGVSPSVLGRGAAGVTRGGFEFIRGVRGIEGVATPGRGTTSQSMMGRFGARISGRALGGVAAMGGEDAGALALGGAGAETGGAGLVGLLAAVPVVGWIAAAVVAITAGGVLLYEKWKPFHDLVDATGRFLERIGKLIAGTVVMDVHALVHAAEAVGSAFAEAYHWVVRIIDKAKDIGGNLLHKATHPWELVGLYTGGPVAPNRPYLVGERGPELFMSAGTMRVVGGDGAELMKSSAPGFVLPNEALRAIERTDVRQVAARAFPQVHASVAASVAPAGDRLAVDLAEFLAGLPPIIIGPENHFAADVDVEQAVERGIAAWFQSVQDRS